jgi:hypothetical protein
MAAPKVIELGGRPTEAEPIPVFSADGVTYTMPAEVSADLALTFIEKLADNEASASLWLLKYLFGRDGYEALKRTATGAQLRAVTDVVSDHVMGAAEGN